MKKVTVLLLAGMLVFGAVGCKKKEGGDASKAGGDTVKIGFLGALTGDIAIMKKHTKNIWTTLEDLAISTIYRSQKNFQQIVCDASQMKETNLSDRQGFELMGYLFGSEVISPRQLTVVRDQWVKPKYVEFEPRNAWSFYNACTEALKSCPPTAAMEKHIELHKVMTERGACYAA